jgi:hypothetical protein
MPCDWVTVPYMFIWLLYPICLLGYCTLYVYWVTVPCIFIGLLYPIYLLGYCTLYVYSRFERKTPRLRDIKAHLIYT